MTMHLTGKDFCPIFGSVGVETMEIKRASTKRVLALAKVEGLKAPL
jgi:hypothetical protein